MIQGREGGWALDGVERRVTALGTQGSIKEEGGKEGISVGVDYVLESLSTPFEKPM
jgi:hypothetical protein